MTASTTRAALKRRLVATDGARGSGTPATFEPPHSLTRKSCCVRGADRRRLGPQRTDTDAVRASEDLFPLLDLGEAYQHLLTLAQLPATRIEP